LSPPQTEWHPTFRLLLGPLLFCAFGLCTEIAFTGLAAGVADSFRGQVSLLMIPVYAFVYVVIGPLLTAADRLGLDSTWRRLPAVVVAIYAIEWSWGALYASLGLQPWHYDHGWASDFSSGHITLLYLPAWLVFGLVVIPVWRAIRSGTEPAAIDPK
jgi:hypothetical protein